MIKQQILYASIGYLQLRVLECTHNKDRYDVTFLSTEYPEWRIWHKSVDSMKCKELLFMYKLRSYLFRLLPPKLTHWLITIQEGVQMNQQSLYNYKKLIMEHKKNIIVTRTLQHQKVYFTMDQYAEWVKQQKLQCHNQD